MKTKEIKLKNKYLLCAIKTLFSSFILLLLLLAEFYGLSQNRKQKGRILSIEKWHLKSLEDITEKKVLREFDTLRQSGRQRTIYLTSIWNGWWKGFGKDGKKTGVINSSIGLGNCGEAPSTTSWRGTGRRRRSVLWIRNLE